MIAGSRAELVAEKIPLTRLARKRLELTLHGEPLRGQGYIRTTNIHSRRPDTANVGAGSGWFATRDSTTDAVHAAPNCHTGAGADEVAGCDDLDDGRVCATPFDGGTIALCRGGERGSAPSLREKAPAAAGPFTMPRDTSSVS